MQAVVSCNDSDVVDMKAVGDPVEVALIVLAAKAGVTKTSAGQNRVIIKPRRPQSLRN